MLAENGGIVCDAGTGRSVSLCFPVAYYRQPLTRGEALAASMRRPLCLDYCHAARESA